MKPALKKDRTYGVYQIYFSGSPRLVGITRSLSEAVKVQISLEHYGVMDQLSRVEIMENLYFEKATDCEAFDQKAYDTNKKKMREESERINKKSEALSKLTEEERKILGL